MMLHAKSLEITHPVNNNVIKIEAQYFSEYQRVLSILEAG
jgi:hypothetical protein